VGRLIKRESLLKAFFPIIPLTVVTGMFSRFATSTRVKVGFDSNSLNTLNFTFSDKALHVSPFWVMITAITINIMKK
jgi:hypothetical protein